MTRPTTNPAALQVACRSLSVDGLKVFYREAGPPDAPTLLLLHGFPSSSHMFRNLIPRLADRFHVVAPDLPGFGFSDTPDRRRFTYTFDKLAHVIERFTDVAGLTTYALYVFDYGAPVGFRLALARPDRVTAIISQNGNAYEEGLSDGWNPIQRYWRDPTAENRQALRELLTPEATKWQYVHGVDDEMRVAPESYTLDSALLSRPGNDEIQLDLFHDYASNVALYPKFHEYFAARRPPLLAVWGRHDPFFLPAGAEAFRRDNPHAKIHLLDTGHFALETHVSEIAAAIRRFLGRVIDKSSVELSDARRRGRARQRSITTSEVNLNPAGTAAARSDRTGRRHREDDESGGLNES
jgi:pimeloyl-ACP methyl ester carboxylesterase